MNVQFANKKDGKFVLGCPHIAERHTIAFRKAYTTSDKEEIRTLLSDPFATERVELIPGQDFEAINEYLEADDQPDTMTREFLRSIPFEAWKEIIDVLDLDVKFPLVGIARAKLEGQPMDDRVERIAKEWKEKTDTPEGKEKEKQNIKKAKENVKKAKKKTLKLNKELAKKKKEESDDDKFDPSKGSSGNLATESAEYILNADEEDLEGFLSEDETRKTVLKAWNERFAEEEKDPEEEAETE